MSNPKTTNSTYGLKDLNALTTSVVGIASIINSYNDGRRQDESLKMQKRHNKMLREQAEFDRAQRQQFTENLNKAWGN